MQFLKDDVNSHIGARGGNHLRIRRPKKKKEDKPIQLPARPRPTAAFAESELSVTARRHGVALTPGPQRSIYGERIEGCRGFIYEGWNTLAMWLFPPSVSGETDFVDFLFTESAAPPSCHSDEIQTCIEQAKAAGLEQHERPDHSHFFRWDADDDEKTSVALRLIGAQRTRDESLGIEPRIAPEVEILTSHRPYKGHRRKPQARPSLART